METALLAATESLCVARGSSLSSVLILLDTVNHHILRSTLAEPGIARSALSWFTTHLTNRTSGHMEWLPLQTLYP